MKNHKLLLQALAVTAMGGFALFTAPSARAAATTLFPTCGFCVDNCHSDLHVYCTANCPGSIGASCSAGPVCGEVQFGVVCGVEQTLPTGH